MRGERLGRWGTAAVTTVVGVVCLTSAAWACLLVQGPIKIKNPENGTYTYKTNGADQTSTGSGSWGGTVKVKAWDLKVTTRDTPPDQKPAYGLYFSPVGNPGCHGATVILEDALNPGALLNRMRTDRYGRLDRDKWTADAQAYKALLPLEDPDYPDGEYEMCVREMHPEPNGSLTAHPATFLIM